MKRAAFFFGAGVSRASGMPLASDIMQSALNEDWHLHTDQNFYPGPAPNPFLADTVTPAVKQFLVIVRDIAAEYIVELARTAIPRQPHYEDLFSLAFQASRPAVEHTPNLAVVEFLRRLSDGTSHLHAGFKGPTGSDGFVGLAEAACHFLHWVVYHGLTIGAHPRKGLDAITDVAAHVDELDIFTLNHDVLVEDQCKAGGVVLEDGFADQRGELRAFNGWREHSRKKVRLFKLHGSVNWFLYDFSGWARQYAIPDSDAFHSHDQHGNLVHPVEWKPAFLSGTVVKEQLYGIGFFGDIFTAFRRHLAPHVHLIVCGYGFGDPGINSRIYQWLSDRLDGSNRLVVLHDPAGGDFFAEKPFWLQDLHANGRLIFLNKWLQDCTAADLSPYFDN